MAFALSSASHTVCKPNRKRTSRKAFRARAGPSAAMDKPSNPQKPLTIGLTGSIGMGKSTVASMLKRKGVPLLDADEAAQQSSHWARFPSAIVNGAVDRKELSKLLLEDKGAISELEAIVHPLVAADREQFLADQAAAGSPVVCLDIPLLFEKGLQEGMDAILVVNTTPEQQEQRVLSRPGMSREKFEAIKARQVPDAKKREQATHVIDTSVSLEETEQQVGAVLQQLLEAQKAKTAHQQNTSA